MGKGILILVKYLVLAAVTFLFASITIRPLFESVASKGIFSNSFRFGDLYRLSNLPLFKEKDDNYFKHCDIPVRKAGDVHLYVSGDSFGNQIPYLLEQAAAGFTFKDWNSESVVSLDSTRKNVLVLETVERNIPVRYSQPSTKMIVENSSAQEVAATGMVNNEDVQARQALVPRIKEAFKTFFDGVFMKDFETMAQDLYFSSDFFLRFRELKAMITLRWFDRVDEKVVIRADEGAIFYFGEADPQVPGSSFAPVSDSLISAYVKNINLTRKYYLEQGFDEVYLALVPNKVSVLDPTRGEYNHLLERVSLHPGLKVPQISVYNEFRSGADRYYLRSDSHWNCNGIRVWVDKLTGALAVVNKRANGSSADRAISKPL